jgi:hypothetical protein
MVQYIIVCYWVASQKLARKRKRFLESIQSESERRSCSNRKRIKEIGVHG